MSVQEIHALIAELFDADISEITPDTHLMNDLEADSLEIIELFLALERTTGVRIPDDQLSVLATVSAVTAYIAQHKGA